MLQQTQIMVKNLELQLKVNFQVDQLAYGLLAAKISLDVWTAFWYALNIESAYSGALTDLSILQEVSQDQVIKKAASRAHDTFQSYLVGVIQKMLAVNENQLNYTRGVATAFGAIQVPDYGVPMARTRDFWWSRCVGSHFIRIR